MKRYNEKELEINFHKSTFWNRLKSLFIDGINFFFEEICLCGEKRVYFSISVNNPLLKHFKGFNEPKRSLKSYSYGSLCKNCGTVTVKYPTDIVFPKLSSEDLEQVEDFIREKYLELGEENLYLKREFKFVL